MSYGPNPWRQTQWDARAAANFMAGGAGSGLVFVGAMLAAAGTAPVVWIACIGLGVALVGAGLTAVWFEIGRPLRALNVIFNPGTSWMAREAMIAPLLFAVAFSLWATRTLFFAVLLALLALAFAYAQGRLLHAAKGIPAWHDGAVPPWIVATAIVEGLGLALTIGVWIAPAQGFAGRALGLALVLGVALRAALWFAYRRRVSASIVAGAARALDAAGRKLLLVGTVLPAVLALAAAATAEPGFARAALLAAAGALAWAGGWSVKFALVCRASFNRGFALAQLPVRGRR